MEEPVMPTTVPVLVPVPAAERRVMTAPTAPPVPERTAVLPQLVRCAARVAALVVRHRLHLHRARVGTSIRTPDGRAFTVFRETSCDGAGAEPEVTLAVRFHLRGTTSASRGRAWLFERESILNTVLYAGFRGYRSKLWMVDRASGDYAGLYAWRGEDAAERYARYITAVLGPLSTPGSVGYQIVPVPLADYLSSTGT
jgi:hypothetical protein